MAILRKSDGFEETEVDDEIVIVSYDSGELFSLKDTGREIWRLIDGTRSQEEIVGALRETYGDDAGRIETEVESFIASLRGASLLEG